MIFWVDWDLSEAKKKKKCELKKFIPSFVDKLKFLYFLHYDHQSDSDSDIHITDTGITEMDLVMTENECMNESDDTTMQYNQWTIAVWYDRNGGRYEGLFTDSANILKSKWHTPPDLPLQLIIFVFFP